jgi:Spy/CpxP family protein refolding chaperone
MRRNLVILVSAAVVVAAGIVVVTAQHPEGQAWTTAAASHAQFIHAACAEGAAGESQPGGSHVPSHLADALGLTAAQLAEIDRLGAEACQAMLGVHERMLEVLTPEQRTSLREMHSGGHHGALSAWLKKLHGAN